MIFNPHLLKLHRKFAEKHIGESDFLIEHAACEIMHDIELLSTKPRNILEVDSRAGHLSRKLVEQYPNAKLIYAQENTFPEGEFDLIVSSMNLHWINEVENHLRKLHSILADDGKLVLNFVSSGSLENLKQYLLRCEIEAGAAHWPHIMPLPKEDKVQTMFQQCGFKFVVVSTEKIELEYENPVKFMKDLKNMGENNALASGIGVLPRNVFTASKGVFYDAVNLVTVVAGK